MTKKVWHISRFRQRYELPDDLRYDRKSPLQYTKDFCGSGFDDESCGYFRQYMSLRSKPKWAELLGYFTVLKNIGGNMSKEYRGYLLDSNFEPASIRGIGRWLGIGKNKAENVVKALSDVGLIELVTLPKFNGQPRKRPGAHGKARKPLKKKTKAKIKVKTKTKKNGKGKSKKENKKRSNKDVPQETRPATTQPIKPQISAKEGRVIQFSASPELKNTELLGDITKGMLHRYNPDAKQFAFEIYQSLKLPWEPTSEEGKRELGCFASVWQKVTGVPPPALDELRERAITEARKIARRRQNRKKGAVWCTVFRNLETAYKQRDYKKCMTI